MCGHQPAATGEWGSVVWIEASGRSPALEFYEGLSDAEAAKVQVLFEKWAEHGRINNKEQFKKLGDRQRHGIWEFKRQLRFLGGMAPGRQFVVAHGLRKKQDKHRFADLDRAARILKEHLARQGQGGHR